MTQLGYPFNSSEVLEDEFSQMARVWTPNGVIGVAGDANLKVIGDSSGMVAKVAPGRASVQGYHFVSTGWVSVSIGSNSSGSPRMDVVVVRLDPSTDSLSLEVKAGTPGSNPVAPTLSRADVGVYEIPLAYVRVNNGAVSITSDNVTEHREHQVNPTCPPGTVLAYDGETLPTGFLWRYGAFLPQSRYWQLYEALTGNEATPTGTFQLPGGRGRSLVGLDPAQSEFHSIGKAGGAKTHKLTQAEMPPHVHEQNAVSSGLPGPVNVWPDWNNGTAAGKFRVFPQGANTESTGGNGSHNNLSPYSVTNFIIKT